MFHFYNTSLNSFNISFYFFGEIIIYSTGFIFRILSSYELVTVSAIFCVCGVLFWNPFFKKNLVLYPIIVIYIFSQMIKIHILLTLICIKRVTGDPSTIFLAISFTQKKCRNAQIPCVPAFSFQKTYDVIILLEVDGVHKKL